MDPVTAGALVTAVNAAVSGAAWARPGGGPWSPSARWSAGCCGGARASLLGEPEPVAIPYDDGERLRQLADLLVERARQDPEFGRDLASWMREHGKPAGEADAVHNTIAGNARITGPVIQGRDFHGPISFG